MPWFKKHGAMYLKANGMWTWRKQFAAKYDEKEDAVGDGMYWSHESPFRLAEPRTEAGKIEQKLTYEFV